MGKDSKPANPGAAFHAELQSHGGLRAAIDALTRIPETELMPQLVQAATLPEPVKAKAQSLARQLIEGMRARPKLGLIQGLMHEYALSSQEGVALMCLAEALLRIPDRATRDALIADKIGKGAWRAHVGHSPSPFVNAATWGLLVTGQLVGTIDETGLSASLTRLIARGGAPIIRASVDTAMRVMGEQFVCSQTIEGALRRAPKNERLGFRYSYDMLGEAAMTAADAARYLESYTHALHAIGTAAAGRGLYDGPGLSIKLSALHPRYQRAQHRRVMLELLPRLKTLALLARHYDVGITIDAEEAERLDLSLDLLEGLCRDPALAGWNGFGFVVQAYQKRSSAVLAFLIDLARQTRHRLMVRLVKGAYWDSEIKRAQFDGVEGFAVFTRKSHTDVAYLAGARQILAAQDAIYPQFATHNALTLASIHALTNNEHDYEFQCLYGMGESLYQQVAGPDHLNRACRIYAPVGAHATLLAYLVRRLLENGANSSFVNRLSDPLVPIESLLEDPVTMTTALDPVGAPHPRIALPRAILGASRSAAAGLDLNNETHLAALGKSLAASAARDWRAGAGAGAVFAIVNPADLRDFVGRAVAADVAQIEQAMAMGESAWPAWRDQAPSIRAQCLLQAADFLEEQSGELAGLIVREAGKTLPNALGDIREAVDFLRYYASGIGSDFSTQTHPARGILACISPWNFPLAIFVGQVSAALAAGNAVIAKPAEETPLIAAAAVRLLHQAGVPEAVLQLLVGDGTVGAALTAHPKIAGVLFTGSIEVARLIQQSLARRLSVTGEPLPLIAETGGMNAMIVDSSALTEQVIADVLASAFDSAGQRCSALRILCLQEDIAERTLAMLKAAMAELTIGPPDRLSTDIGPVISAAARAKIQAHITEMRARGFAVHAQDLGEACAEGYFVAPTLIEITSPNDLTCEIFGPVLHSVRFARDTLGILLESLNAMGYGLTGGVHSRIDNTINQVVERLAVGNIYVNRTITGAVVGVQPFGGHGLSGTGPKAGGPLYLKRLLRAAPSFWPDLVSAPPPPAVAAHFCDRLEQAGKPILAARCRSIMARSRLGIRLELPGPVGETNHYTLRPRGAVLCHARREETALTQIASAFSTGNRAVLAGPVAASLWHWLPQDLRTDIALASMAIQIHAALTDSEDEDLRSFLQHLAEQEGAIIPVYSLTRVRFDAGEDWPLDGLLSEQTITINTAAIGGNADLMSLEMCEG